MPMPCIHAEQRVPARLARLSHRPTFYSRRPTCVRSRYSRSGNPVLRRGRLSDARVITASGATARTVTYLYNTADQVTQITYPSGRIVFYTRDTMGRISAVTTKKTSADPLVNIATAITYQPISRLVAGFTYGNALTYANTYTNDYELSQCQVKDGAAVVLGRSFARTDKLNITGITDQVTATNNQTFGHSAANRLNSATGPYGAQSWIYDGVGNRTSQVSIRPRPQGRTVALRRRLRLLPGARLCSSTAADR